MIHSRNRLTPVLAWGTLMLTIPVAVSAQAKPTAAHAAAMPATIINTGYGYFPGYQIAVGADGGLESAPYPKPHPHAIRRHDRLITPTRDRFFQDLAAAGPLDRLPTASRRRTSPVGRRGRYGRRPPPATHAVGPGPRIFVRYEGRLSPDLREAGTPAGQKLYQDVKQIVQVLRLPIPDKP